jgi:GTP cyclohydrolase I
MSECQGTGDSARLRLVEAHARRLQVQERMTADIVADLMAHLRPLGAGCVVRAAHSCMACRGIRKQGAETPHPASGRRRVRQPATTRRCGGAS